MLCFVHFTLSVSDCIMRPFLDSKHATHKVLFYRKPVIFSNRNTIHIPVKLIIVDTSISWIYSLNYAVEVVLIIHLLILSESNLELRSWLSYGRLLILGILLFIFVLVFWLFNIKYLHIIVQGLVLFISFWFILWSQTCRKKLSICWFPSLGEHKVFAMSNGIISDRWSLGCLGTKCGVCNRRLIRSRKSDLLILTFGCQDRFIKRNILGRLFVRMLKKDLVHRQLSVDVVLVEIIELFGRLAIGPADVN